MDDLKQLKEQYKEELLNNANQQLKTSSDS